MAQKPKRALVAALLSAALTALALDAGAACHTLVLEAAARLDRNADLQRLRSEEFDIVIIGGGSAGLGAAVDAVSRGLKVALIESNDFAAETSSRSTKLLHGGVRYLEQLAMSFLRSFRFDRVLYNLIRDALKERTVVMRVAPHLAKPLPIVTPIYNSAEVPYYWAGLKAYDLIAGRGSLPPSRLLSARQVAEQFPMLNREGLKAGVLYYDGQFNDARLAMALALTARQNGAAVVNHARVAGLIKTDERVAGVIVQDKSTNSYFPVHARAVINATGPFTDHIRQIDDPEAKPIMAVSSGTHLVLSGKFVAPESGILIPKTEDGRVVFILPWEGHTLVGTTDNQSDLVENPRAEAGDVDYILQQIAPYFPEPPTRADVLSQWTGLRPLVADPNSADTAKLARDHVVQTSASGLVTITGGKWTTYRVMAEHVVNEAIRSAGLNAGSSATEDLVLVGGQGYHDDLAMELAQEYKVDTDIAEHLATTYGDQARFVLEIAATENAGQRLLPRHPFIEAEVIFSCRNEAAQSPMDVVARRFRLSFIDQTGLATVLPRVTQIMAEELNWSNADRDAALETALNYFSTRPRQ